MPNPQFRIAIVGAGPAGLTLGVLLHKRGIPCTVFELRQAFTDEELAKPAGSLDLHEESGLAALREAGLYEEFTTLIDDCTEAQRIANLHGQVIYAEGDDQDGERPEISRHKLIKLLLSHLPPSSFKWGHKLLSARHINSAGDPEVELDFGDKGTHTFDLVIGADGAWSKIRSLLTNERPQYVGIQSVNLNLRNVTSAHPHLAELIGSGTFMALGNRHGVCAQRSVSDSARIYLFVSTEDEHFAESKNLKGKTPLQAKDTFLADDSVFGQWGANIKELVSVTCDDHTADNAGEEIDIKALHKLPAGHSWKHQAGATLIGDAAHLMNPPAGEGVNIAMQDALLLSQAIIKAYDDKSKVDTASLKAAMDPLVAQFEQEMVPRAQEMADGTAEVNEIMFCRNDGAQVMTDWFNSFRQEPKEAPKLE